LNKSALIGSIIETAKAIAPLVPMGAQGLAAGRAVLNLIDEVKETAGAAPEKIAEFEATREEMERAVNAHADRTAASLG
jgi:hypothetical protein